MQPFAEKVLLRSRKKRSRRFLSLAFIIIGTIISVLTLIRAGWVALDMVEAKENKKQALAAKGCSVPLGTDISNLVCRDGEAVDKDTGEVFIPDPMKETI